MDKFFELCLEDAPLREILDEVSRVFGTSMAMQDAQGGLIAASTACDHMRLPFRIPLVWKDSPVGTLLHAQKELPNHENFHTIILALAGQLYLRSTLQIEGGGQLWNSITRDRNCQRAFQVKAWQETQNTYVQDEASCLLLYIDSSRLSEEHWRFIFQQARKDFSEGVTAFDEQSIYILFYGIAPAFSAAIQPRFLRLMRAAGCQGVVSQPFAANALSRQLILVRLAMLAGRNIDADRNMYKFEEYASYVYFMVLQRQMNLPLYHCDEVIRVLDHDYEKGTELGRSLYMYLFYFSDYKAAAQEARLHRNTLENHIKKIETILGRLPDKKLRFEMMFTYSMLAVVDLT